MSRPSAQQAAGRATAAAGHTIRTLAALVAAAARHGRLDVIRAVNIDIGGRMGRIRRIADRATNAAIRRATEKGGECK